VIWDNRCLLHKANGDYDMDQTRYLYRVMLQGDVPRWRGRDEGACTRRRIFMGHSVSWRC